MKKILLIDDSDTYIWNLRKYLQRRGYPVKTASTLNEARAAIQEEMPLVVCCDLDLPDGSGMDFLDEVRITDKKLPFILVSCHDKDDYEQEAIATVTGTGTGAAIDSVTRAITKEIDFASGSERQSLVLIFQHDNTFAFDLLRHIRRSLTVSSHLIRIRSLV